MRNKILAAVASAALAITGLVTAPSIASADTETTTVNIMLQGHDNDDLDLREGTVTVYRDGAWRPVEGTNPNNRNVARVELEPGTYSFAVEYNGTRNQKSVTVSGDSQTVYFGTALVKLDLIPSKGALLPVDEGGALYYGGGSWRTFDPNVGVEMQPGTYSFAVIYKGVRQQKSFTVVAKNANNGADAEQTVEFRTVPVSIMLRGHDDSALDLRNGTVSYYAGGRWHTITDVAAYNNATARTELLPGTYSIAVVWNGTREQQNSILVRDSAKSVYFRTSLVNTALTIGGVAVNPSQVTSTYYGNPGSWRALDAAGVEMLPGTYSFAVVNNGVRQQQSYTVLKRNANTGANSTQTVEFVR